MVQSQAAAKVEVHNSVDHYIRSCNSSKTSSTPRMDIKLNPTACKGLNLAQSEIATLDSSNY